MNEFQNNKQFPEFFTSKDPVPTSVSPLKFGNDTYWMCNVTTEYEPETSHRKPYLKPYEDNDEGILDCGDIEDNYDIVLTKSGKFMTSFYVPSSLLSYIIGAKGSKLKHLQRNTNTLIKVPRPNEKGDVKITGDTERKVASARTQISMIVMQRKDRLPVSHFISLPMNSEDIKHGFEEFRDKILANSPRGVTLSIFQKPDKLHLTLCTLTLVDEDELENAKKVLQNCYDEYISKLFNRNEKKYLSVKGLQIMNDDPSEVNVLYGCVELDQTGVMVQEMADKITEYYYNAGLARRCYEKVKLHLTFLNTSYRNPDEEKGKFDATNILKEYGNFHFGKIELRNIQLSIRFTTKDEYYQSALTISI